jgi:hypothetical protein
MFQTKVVEKIKTYILCSVTFFFENCAVYEIMWNNIVEWGRTQMAIWHMCNACWIPKPTNTHSQVVYYSLLFHCSSGSTNTQLCYVICTLPVLFQFQIADICYIWLNYFYIPVENTAPSNIIGFHWL